MSPEVALLVRAALLGLLVFALERLGRRRREKRAEAERTIIRLPPTSAAPSPLQGRPIVVEVARNADTRTASATPDRPGIVRLEPYPKVGAETRPLGGHVTEKRAA